MKLIFAVVSDEDGHEVMKAMVKAGFGVTKLASTGGFLRAGNLTLMCGVDEERLEEAMKLIEDKCHTRKQILATPIMTEYASSLNPYPVEVEVGGATVFVVDVERFEKI